MEKLNFIIAKNLSELRKKNKLTQLELAEKLNYSDKAVSKWEQGESIPGVEVLYKLGKLYGVGIDYIVGDKVTEPERKREKSATVKKNHRIITLLSILAVWLIATVFYIFFNIFGSLVLWQVFCWAVPASLIVAIVFDVIWHEKKLLFLLISLLVWTVLLCFCFQFFSYNIWIILCIGIPLQAATLLWAWLVR